MEITVSAARYRRWLTILVLALTAVSFAGSLAMLFLHLRPRGLLRIVNMDLEASIPTWYSSVNLAVSAALLAAIAATVRARKGTHDLFAWSTLAFIFTCLSLDEISGIHESVGSLIRTIVPTSGYFRFAWVIPALAALPFLGATFFGFLTRLTARRRAQFLVGGFLFVVGAVGMEMIGAKFYAEAGDQPTLPFIVCFHIEEFLEMISIVLFNAALIEHLTELQGPPGLRLRFAHE